MKEKQKTKKLGWHQYIGLAFGVLVGAVSGILMVEYLDASASAGRSTGEELLSLGLLLLALYGLICVHVILHEAGHLVFGLLSGYEFGSFRIQSYMWVRQDGRLRCKRLTIAGTGGQCLMTPPDSPDWNFPVILYNLGGSLMNLIWSGIGFLFCLLMERGSLGYTILMIFVLAGILLGLMNGVPMRMGMVDNDGYNAISLSRDAAARRAFWVQLKVNQQIAQEVRLKDMPEEWFAVPADEGMKNSMVVVMGIFAANRLMDEHRFEEADSLMFHLMEIESGMVDLHRQLLVCDRICVELLGENRKEVLEEMLSKKQKSFMKSMKNFPSVLRTEYMYALLGTQDTCKAGKIKEQFEKRAKSYPYPGEIQGERELMEMAEQFRSGTSG